MTLEQRNAVRFAMTDPIDVVQRLGLAEGARRAGRNVFICCPVHGDRKPSCSVHVANDRTVAFRCWACGWTGDLFTAIAVLEGLSLPRDFGEVLRRGAELANVSLDAPTVRRALPPLPPREPPPLEEVRALLGAAVSVTRDAEAAAWLRSRWLDPRACAPFCWALRFAWPRWARYQGEADTPASWLATGHRLVMPVYDAAGALRSVRVRLVRAGDEPKSLPPSGHATAGLVLANRAAVDLLRAGPRAVAPCEECGGRGRWAGELGAVECWRCYGCGSEEGPRNSLRGSISGRSAPGTEEMHLGERTPRQAASSREAGAEHVDRGVARTVRNETASDGGVGVALPPSPPRPVRFLVVEGEPDFLTWASRLGRGWAVIGLPGSGAWSRALADRIPDGSLVVVRTDPDRAGDAYAAAIAADLGARCTVRESDPAGRRRRRACRTCAGAAQTGPAREAQRACRSIGTCAPGLDENARLQRGELPADPIDGTEVA